ncbi:MAG: hypothetical protein CMN73_11480 [Sphingomonas sp.]|nr:hypothetical protein [Sphingomonas sp.]
MSADGPKPVTNDAAYMVDYVKVRPFFNSAYVIRGKDDVRTAEIPDVVVSISDAARAAYAGMTAQQISEIGKYRQVGEVSEDQAPMPDAPPRQSATPPTPQVQAPQGTPGVADDSFPDV